VKPLIIPGQLATFQSLKDRTLKLIFETGEPSPEQMQMVMYSLQKAGYIAFNPDPFSEAEKELLSNIKVDYEDTGKSKGQRLRAVLYRNWEQSNQGHDVFDDYYNANMERMITYWKRFI